MWQMCFVVMLFSSKMMETETLGGEIIDDKLLSTLLKWLLMGTNVSNLMKHPISLFLLIYSSFNIICGSRFKYDFFK